MISEKMFDPLRKEASDVPKTLIDKLSRMSPVSIQNMRDSTQSEYDYYKDRLADLEAKRLQYLRVMDEKIRECHLSMEELQDRLKTIDKFVYDEFDEHPVEAIIDWPLPDDEVPF